MRSIRKVHLRFSLVAIPIQIFNGVESSNTIIFKQLHNIDDGRILYMKGCTTSEDEVPHNGIVKGFVMWMKRC